MTTARYKPISRLAVGSLVTAFIGTMAFVFAPLVAAAAFAIPMGVLAFRAARKYELGGRNLALVATAIATLCVLLAPVWHRYLYASETLPGYARVPLDLEDTSTLDSLDGKRLCVKGYSFYFGGDPEVRSFLLSPDGNNCKKDAAITVLVPSSWHQEYDPIAVSGVLRVDTSVADPRKRYTLSAVKVSTATTSDKLSPRSTQGWGC